jgi:hypothetical protein
MYQAKLFSQRKRVSDAFCPGQVAARAISTTALDGR